MHLKYSDIIHWKCNEPWRVELIPGQVSMQDFKTKYSLTKQIFYLKVYIELLLI